MKTIFQYILILISITCLFTACDEDSFLEENPLDFFSPSNSFVTFGDFESAVYDLYAQLRSLRFSGDDNAMAGFYGTDIMFDARASTTNNRFGDYNITLNPTSGMPVWHWQRLYKIATSANTIIDRVGVGKLTADQQNLIVAEARFFRAYAYRNLAYLFGDVPLLLNEVTSPKTDFIRTNRVEVLKQVIEDATFAAQNLPVITTVADGRISNLAAYHLLAEVHLVLNNWSEAVAAASIVINDPATNLMTSRFGNCAGEPGDVYFDLFCQGNQNRSTGNTEAIWVAQMETDVPGGFLLSTAAAGNTLERQHAPAIFTLQDPNGKAGSLG